MSQWPDSITMSVKAIQPGPFGTKIVLNDKLAARRIILEQTGKLKGGGAGRSGSGVLNGSIEFCVTNDLTPLFEDSMQTAL